MKTPWNELPTRDERALVDVVGYLNDTLDELLSLAKHVAPAIERIAYPEIRVDASGIRIQRERIGEGRRRDEERYWLVKTGGHTFTQTQLDVTELMTHHKFAGEAPVHHRENSHQAIAWASGWDALRCTLLGIEQR